jgi:hypothetical protein
MDMQEEYGIDGIVAKYGRIRISNFCCYNNVTYFVTIVVT